jgi:hypothetical protein
MCLRAFAGLFFGSGILFDFLGAALPRVEQTGTTIRGDCYGSESEPRHRAAVQPRTRFSWLLLIVVFICVVISVVAEELVVVVVYPFIQDALHAVVIAIL